VIAQCLVGNLASQAVLRDTSFAFLTEEQGVQVWERIVG
jgi:hypothetical protein